MTILSNRVISIFERKTSMRLAKSEWNILDSICLRENIKRKKLLEMIDTHKDPKLGLTPSVRLFTLLYMHNLARRSNNYSFTIDSGTIAETLEAMKH